MDKLLADVWHAIGDGKVRRKFGSDFSRAVKLKEFPGVIRLPLKDPIRDRPYHKER